MIIYIQSMNGIIITATITDTAYMPGFHINILSIKKLNKKGYFWDNVNRMFLKGKQLYAYIPEKYGQ